MWCYILCNHLHVQSYECRRLGDRFREHLHDIERNDKDASKPVAKHFNLSTYSIQHMAVSGLSLNLGTSESRKTREKIYLPNRHSKSPWYRRVLWIQLIYSCFLVTIFPPTVQLHCLQINPHTTHNSSNRSDDELTLESSAFALSTVANLRFHLNC